MERVDRVKAMHFSRLPAYLCKYVPHGSGRLLLAAYLVYVIEPVLYQYVRYGSTYFSGFQLRKHNECAAIVVRPTQTHAPGSARLPVQQQRR